MKITLEEMFELEIEFEGKAYTFAMWATPGMTNSDMLTFEYDGENVNE